MKPIKRQKIHSIKQQKQKQKQQQLHQELQCHERMLTSEVHYRERKKQITAINKLNFKYLLELRFK